MILPSDVTSCQRTRDGAEFGGFQELIHHFDALVNIQRDVQIPRERLKVAPLLRMRRLLTLSPTRGESNSPNREQNTQKHTNCAGSVCLIMLNTVSNVKIYFQTKLNCSSTHSLRTFCSNSQRRV